MWMFQQFERAMFFGALISLDSFLTVTFAIPFRGIKAFCMLLFGYRRQLTPEAVIDMAWVLMIVAGVAILLLQVVRYSLLTTAPSSLKYN
jgi:hypothetical protein